MEYPVSSPIPEDEMKSLLTVTAALILVLAIACWSLASETEFDDLNRFDRGLRGWKFGRGVVNILSGPHELVTQMTNEAIKGSYSGAYDSGLHGYLAGAANGYIAGFGRGVYFAVKRMSVGALEVLTFWKPEYGPTMDPEWGTRNLAFGARDYFDPDPFWYTGSER
jgi:putative exosortase-associated protein (TIGR04073 family)